MNDLFPDNIIIIHKPLGQKKLTSGNFNYDCLLCSPAFISKHSNGVIVVQLAFLTTEINYIFK